MVARAVSTFSLALLLLALAGAETYTSLSSRIAGRPPSAVIDIVADTPEGFLDDEISEVLIEAMDAEDAQRDRLGERLHAMVDLKAMAEGAGGESKAAAEAAREIKRSPMYRDAGVEEESNWLGRALSRLRNISLPKASAPRGPNFAIGAWLNGLVWVLLGAAGAFLLYLAVRHIRWKATLVRRAKAVLEEDEPDRTLDEWLAQADALAAEGLHREAVRALYLACLLRFDEHRVARFVRGETNWEHLIRIQASDRRPPELDFRPATQAFDRIWYGKQTRGREDVEQFRAWYQQITAILAGRAA
ncbi:MAG: DUF4129 domain-containing protein [Fimbriimonas sp.]